MMSYDQEEPDRNVRGSKDTASYGRPNLGANLFRIVVGAAAICVIVATWFSFSDRIDQKKAEKEHAAMVELRRENARKADEDAGRLIAAVKAHRAILGMNRSEVEIAKGKPYMTTRGEEQTSEAIKLKSTETWVYRDDNWEIKCVCFDHRGQVIYSTDLIGLPAFGNAIRQ